MYRGLFRKIVEGAKVDSLKSLGGGGGASLLVLLSYLMQCSQVLMGARFWQVGVNAPPPPPPPPTHTHTHTLNEGNIYCVCYLIPSVACPLYVMSKMPFVTFSNVAVSFT